MCVITEHQISRTFLSSPRALDAEKQLHLLTCHIKLPFCFSPSWVQGFTNRNVGFVNSMTICYPCGNYVIFVNIDTQHRSFLRCPHGSIGAFAVNASQHAIAFSDKQLNPVIYIYSFPALKKIAKLKGRSGDSIQILLKQQMEWGRYLIKNK